MIETCKDCITSATHVNPHFLAGKKLRETKKGATTLACYAYDTAGRLSTRTLGNGVITTYAYDSMSRLTQITVVSGGTSLWTERYVYNAAGATLETYTYTAWGEPSVKDASNTAVAKNDIKSRFLYTAREYDKESLIYHYRARAYNVTLGRFQQIDPIGFAAGDVNLYRYVANNPINLWDPLGLDYRFLNDSSAAGGQGHSGSLVGNDETGYDYYSKDGYPPAKNIRKHYDSLDDFYNDSISDRYDRQVVVPTTPE
ncbi:MAG: RHS repeat-associated core domain-containing protein [Chthoniobacterales bacterium]